MKKLYIREYIKITKKNNHEKIQMKRTCKWTQKNYPNIWVDPNTDYLGKLINDID